MTTDNGDRIDTIEAILERMAERQERMNKSQEELLSQQKANAINIARLVEDRRLTNVQIDRNSQQIAQMARNQGAMFEIVQELSRDRVVLSENLALIAQSLAQLAQRQ